MHSHPFRHYLPKSSLPYSPFCVHNHQMKIRIIILRGSMYATSAIDGVRLHSVNPCCGVMSISPPSVWLVRSRYSLGPSQCPYTLDARVSHRWDGDRARRFRKTLQAHVPHICHLRITADNFRLRRTFEGLVLPAPTFECLVVVSTGDSAVKR